MEDQEFSIILSKSLDCMGYSKECIRTRQDSSVETARIINEIKDNVDRKKEFVPIGSQAEGIANFYEFQTYFYYLDSINAICCVDDVRGVNLGEIHEIFYADTDSTATGYVSLEHIMTATNIERPREVVEQYGYLLVKSTFVIERGTSLISSDSFSAEEHKRNELIVKRSGPAVLGFLDENKKGVPSITRQTVPTIMKIAIPFKCGSIIKPWTRRDRKHGWPPRSVVEQIEKMDSHIVPGGHRLSDSRNHEWEICFGAAEKQLVFTMNDTQLRLYALLRLVCKRVFKLVCQNISSYMMKTVVFWVSEKIPLENFRPCLLKKLLIYALQLFKEGLMSNNLPDYFLTEHNVLHGAVSNADRQLMLILLSEILTSDLNVLFILPALGNLRQSMSTVLCFPNIALTEQKSREVANRVNQIIRQRQMNVPVENIHSFLDYKNAIRQCIAESNNDSMYVKDYISAFSESTIGLSALDILEICIEIPMFSALMYNLSGLEHDIDLMVKCELGEALVEYLLT